MTRPFVPALRPTVFALVAAAAPMGVARAQGAPHLPKVCVDGVKLFEERSAIPTPFDTLTMPPSDGPIRVSSPEEAAAAERMVLEQAGSVGATGLLMTTEREEVDGSVRMRRRVTPVFAASDTARAYGACRKKE